ncbi:rac GTPase-activating protein 1-like [Syngnathoides biaculeatus]|uniref:rac GTPase-activating protein 1-like n=1 Tax=Syngnathoides biaculeatus TaxID=300417 RepID=UPI002ADE5446|nr:rac GTPase-activating protein 1-like [Syngnathoides biaculeatus]XP_061689701.1 rac GTPase-activating protein 1-like [Syngnathoides biaculeatus]XP_061689703.1 rac GTPase-activating protein 1-like [Syngnathoides biaculeatus]XP_061689704.1 rac GTPase-activating protein 1-like [Syngnathoides biaculeatus]
MEMTVVNLYNQFQSFRAQLDCLHESVEPQFLQMAINFEECRKKWLLSGEELLSCKEMLAKAESERGALEVRLKHARNQVDVEIRRRQKAEAVYEKLDRQLQLIRDMLKAESSSSIHLSEEQRSALAFLSAHSQAAQAAKSNLNSSRRLMTIDESTSIISDISFDQTDDSLGWDSSATKTVRLQKRPKRRSSRKLEVPPQAIKKPRSTGCPSDRINDSIVAKTTITLPVPGGTVEAVSTIETIPYGTRSRKKSAAKAWGESPSSELSEINSEAPNTKVSDFSPQFQTPKADGGRRKQHLFVAKTVIKSEFCTPCGRRTKFGKMYLRCQDCKMVTHPECKDCCPMPCNPVAISTPVRTAESTLADFAPVTSPRIPALVIYCIKEIERRGLHEVGLYRISGQERQVKVLKEKLIRGKTLPPLNKIDDINIITSVLKDFLRNLPEPILTFGLNKGFMEAAEIQDDGNSLALLYHAISELPQPNRDTLACLMIHLQKVSKSVDTKMDVTNLAKVFGPTLVGHSVPNPDTMTILSDTSRQPRVIERLFSMPTSYWSQYAYPDNIDMADSNLTGTPNRDVSILGPLTTPEHQMMTKTPSSSSLSKRMMQTLSSTTIFGGKSKAPGGKFFESPHLK